MSSSEIQQSVTTLIGGLHDPHADRSLSELNAVKSVVVAPDGSASVQIELPYPANRYLDSLKQKIDETLSQADITGLKEVAVEIGWSVKAHAVQKGIRRLDGIKNILAVASGKGGVGKSTTSVNLALALRAEGASVGLLDADIYGPSQPRMMNLSGNPESTDGKTLQPKENYGIRMMSIGFMVEEEKPTIWRGPMVTQALEQMLTLTRWGELDYLVIDLPPGTGDTQLTLAQKVPVSGAIIITTPQDISLVDARKGLRMFEEVGVPVLGVVENMSFHICPDCGRESHLFGQGGGEKLAAEAGINLLASLPLDDTICSQTDAGNPTVVAEPEGRVAALYQGLARRSAARLALQNKDYSTRFPNIVIQNT